MRIGVLGANFKSCEMAIREAVALACQRRLMAFNPQAHRLQCVVLSTCNRVEIYFSALDLSEAHSELLHILQEEITDPFEHYLYSYFGIDCFLHLAQVTAGLDSAIVAESEIQRQVKVAYQNTVRSCELYSGMHYLFQKSLQLGKSIRSEFPLSSQGMTLPKLLFKIGQQQEFEMAKIPILFIGNSQINRQVISFFKYKGCQHLTLCSRASRVSREWAERSQMEFLPWESKEEWIRFPWIISGAGGLAKKSLTPFELSGGGENTPPCADYLNLGALTQSNDKELFGKTTRASDYVINMPSQRVQARLICDLGVPRTVNPQLYSQEDLLILNMEDLIQRLGQEQTVNQELLESAQRVIVERVQFYWHAFLTKGRYQLCI